VWRNLEEITRVAAAMKVLQELREDDSLTSGLQSSNNARTKVDVEHKRLS
jgi:hypothetical protein